ncbi:DNA integrity scanning protein DisA [Bacillus sp. THAF10]|uniref:DNA integrity scanning diadenylate cyclase DisA n=1 Tax=Bacillus sp. THAF10 TaxID=2587848 RepID=UPI0012696752|nr:DNA integrity scanning diadenylate cyclase DisA [Bacillus sp. THAF10]QFT87161.1 DNA integrity scanning protein DisA [Bacillus sp. THAF10]
MEEQRKKDVMADTLQFIAPGTPIREGINNILRSKTGGLVVVGFNEKVRDMVDGGFSINCSFSPAYVYELAKMDGAIILNEKGTKILYANAQLTPNPTILSTETGMRHRTAERVAKQTGCLVIAISQRRNVITLYKGDFRYALRDIGVIFTKANQAIQTLEKYKTVLDQGITTLGALEFEEQVSLSELLQVVHRIEMVLRIKNEIISYINELGTEGRLIRLQMTELLAHIEEEAILLIKDYCADKDMDAFLILKRLQDMANTDLLDDAVILKMLGYSGFMNQDEMVLPRGYRVLHKIPRLPPLVIENLVCQFQKLKHILTATVEELDEVDGIGEVRARKIKEGLKRIQDQLLIDRQM